MAIDLIHEAVKNALEKDGWTIIDEQVSLRFGEIGGYVDLEVERPAIVAVKNEEKIFVEIKTFAGSSFVRDLQQAIGQYELYRDIIRYRELEHRLFLAIPQSVYDYYFVRPTTKRIIQDHNILLIVVDLDREEIVK